MNKHVEAILRGFACDTSQFTPLVGDARILQGPIPIDDAMNIWFALRHAHPHTNVWPILRSAWPLEHESALERRDPIQVLQESTDAALAQYLKAELRHMRHTQGPQFDLSESMEAIAIKYDHEEWPWRSGRQVQPKWPGPQGELFQRIPNVSAGLDVTRRPHTTHAALCLFESIEPCDTLAWLGFADSCNAPDTEVLLPAARRWYTRHGARPMFIGYDVLEFFVERPPTSEPECLTLVLEQKLLCSEITGGTELKIRDVAEGLAGAPYWFFWWD